MFRKHKYAAMMFMLLGSCGVEQEISNPSIYGGHEFNAEGTAYVNLWRQGSTRPFCSGVFIERDVVLTAAHCLDGISSDKILINNRIQVLSTRFTDYKVPDVPVNEDRTFDVGVLKTAEVYEGPLPRIPTRGESIDLSRNDLYLRASGNFDKNDKYSVDILESRIEYRMDWGYYGFEFVAGTRQNHPCRGNSGGSLSFESEGETVVVGLVSRRFAYDLVDNCSAEPAGIFADIRSPEIIDWINQNKRQL